jgi:hypothetical protein
MKVSFKVTHQPMGGAGVQKMEQPFFEHQPSRITEQLTFSPAR